MRGSASDLRSAAILLALACGAAACAWSPVEPYSGTAPPAETVYVVAAGWHTEIGLSVEALSGPMTSLQFGRRDARYLVFGWGERDYYMTPAPGLADLAEAALPGSSVMLIIPLESRPTEFFTPSATVLALPVSKDGLERLSGFLWGYLQKDQHGLPVRVGDGPYAGSGFYASTGTYSLANTCNSWTAEALHIAGLPVSAAGVVFADQVLDRVRAMARSTDEGASE